MAEFSSNLGLGNFSEVDESKDPLVYREFTRLRIALNNLALAVDAGNGSISGTSGYIPYGAASGTSASAAFSYVASAGRLNVSKIGRLSSSAIGFSESGTTPLLGFFSKVAAPIAQPSNSIADTSILGGGGSTAVDISTTWDGYTIGQIVTALRTLGILA